MKPLKPLYLNGWRPDLEEAALAAAMLPRWTAPVRNTKPKTIDYRPFLKTENQGAVGSCQGHAMSSLVELLIWLMTGRVVQLSRMFAYLRTQERDGIRGDRGSSIAGGAWVAKEIGVPLEKYFPYPGRYVSSIPPEAVAHAGEARVLEVVHLKTGSDCREWLQAERTGILLGMAWRRSMSSGQPVVEDYGGGGGGGHALLWAGASRREDSNGERYTWQFNSHSESHGNEGEQELSPKCVDQVLEANQFGAYGLRGVRLAGTLASTIRQAA